MNLLFFLAVAIAMGTSPAQARTSIPAMAEICGIRVGWDSMESLEKAIGRGLPQIGGHPHGARLWRSRAARCLIWADGFYYRDGNDRPEGRVVDGLSITRLEPSDFGIPFAAIPTRQLRFMGIAAIGMSKAEVIRLMKAKLPPGKIAGEALVWEATGFYQVNRVNNIINTKWRAELRFASGKLQEILVECE